MSNGVLEGVAGFGTGFMQGMNAAMQTRLNAAADKRMLKYKADLENDLRRQKDADDHERLMKAFGPLQTQPVAPPDLNTVVTATDVQQGWEEAARREMIPLIQSGIRDERTLASYKEKIVDRLRKDSEKSMLTYLGIAGQQIANGDAAGARASLVEASKHNPNGFALLADPQSDGYIVVDEGRKEIINRYRADQFPDAVEMLFVPPKERRQRQRQERQEARETERLRIAKRNEARAVDREQRLAGAQARDDALSTLEAQIGPEAEPNMAKIDDLAREYEIATTQLNPPKNRRIARTMMQLVSDVNSGKVKATDFAGPPERVANGYRVKYRGGPSMVISPQLASFLEDHFSRSEAS